jgi:ketosteroid isomerase-like protein
MSQAAIQGTQSRSAPKHNVRQRVDQLVNYINQGRIIDAMYEFYAPDTQMQENGNPPTVGLEANVEREKQFLAGVKEWKAFTVKALAAEGDVSFMESVSEFVGTDGTPVRAEQVSVARWRDGKIVHERFYYDTAK